MTAGTVPLLATGVPVPVFVAWTAAVLLVAVGKQLLLLRSYRRFVRETEAKIRRLEQRSDEYEERVDAELAQLRAELDAYGAWSDANDRFFHHGLVAVSHMLGAKALPARRACATERLRTSERRATETAWRPVPIRTGSSPPTKRPTVRVQRRTCQ
ncbi:hypothetical protein [Candidatus Poriferisodalis sp.]|uniref:hypothetical protein n=1 Tax=Candidatus Poriferisodalis sp. TaxID=3101277 RepID=UPI003B01C86B